MALFGLFWMSEDQNGGIEMCQLSLPGFDGSADAFLALVTQRKLSADEVPLADVTRQFLSHITDTEHLNLQLAGELMAASARLMMLKSTQLLVQPDAEDDDEALEHRPFDPAQRHRYGDAVTVLAALEGRESFLPFAPPFQIERRVSPRSPAQLLHAWNEMKTRTTAPQQHVTVPGFVRLEVAVSGLIRALRSGSIMVFRQLVRGTSRNDTVVHFIAVLELVRQGRIRTEQEQLFGDISLQWVTNSAESTSRVG
jgi:segregation and condensation protein A